MSKQALIGLATQVSPGIGAPVVRVVIAGHADFIAVEDGRRAGHGELDQGSDPEALFACCEVVGVEFFLGAGFMPG